VLYTRCTCSERRTCNREVAGSSLTHYTLTSTDRCNRPECIPRPDYTPKGIVWPRPEFTTGPYYTPYTKMCVYPGMLHPASRSHARNSVTIEYDVVLVQARCCFEARKVTAGLASHKLGGISIDVFKRLCERETCTPPSRSCVDYARHFARTVATNPTKDDIPDTARLAPTATERSKKAMLAGWRNRDAGANSDFSLT